MDFSIISGLALHYRQEGKPDGLPLIFINSLGTDFRIWDQVAQELAESFRILRYDKRGHGLTDCPSAPYSIRDFSADLAELLDSLNIRRSIIVGISVGGMIAIDFAATWPELVDSLVLCDTAPVIGTREMWNERISALRQDGLAPLADAILSRWFSPAFVRENAAAYSGYANMLSRTPVEGYTGTCQAIRDADLTEAAKKIKNKTLVLCGLEDLATPPELVHGICDLMPQAQYREIAGAAHLPCIERPREMADRISSFLRSN